MLINMFIGVVYGAVSGYYGGWVDMVMQRIIEIIGGNSKPCSYNTICNVFRSRYSSLYISYDTYRLDWYEPYDKSSVL